MLVKQKCDLVSNLILKVHHKFYDLKNQVLHNLCSLVTMVMKDKLPFGGSITWSPHHIQTIYCHKLISSFGLDQLLTLYWANIWRGNYYGIFGYCKCFSLNSSIIYGQVNW